MANFVVWFVINDSVSEEIVLPISGYKSKSMQQHT